ncbi:hypothetical protein A9K55_001567 [Cordyceps militaris]|uniref:Uncharacterized protein n=1 Tax=Cordyceps militaris TaxID=73501 RepID=A0A2H4SQM4_CORMI|nr:hypothetical protein A9K55_001567 [Cordyceps militaris]
MAPETNNPCSWADWRVVSWVCDKKAPKPTRRGQELVQAGKLLNPGRSSMPLSKVNPALFSTAQIEARRRRRRRDMGLELPRGTQQAQSPDDHILRPQELPSQQKKSPIPPPLLRALFGGGPPGFIASRETDTHGIGEGGAFSGASASSTFAQATKNLAARPFAIPPSHTPPPVWNAYNPQQKATCMMDLKFLFTRLVLVSADNASKKKKGGTGCTTKTSPILANRTAGSGLTAGRERSAQNSVARLV